MTIDKQKQQVIVLGAILAIIVGALIYTNLDRFIPTPTGNAEKFAVPVRPALPQKIDTGVLLRPDFPAAQDALPEPNTGTDGVEEIFSALP